MRIRTEVSDDQVAVCSASGELDAYTAPDLRDCLDNLLSEEEVWIIVDLSELTYLDSTGLGILVGTAKKCRQAQGDLAVVCDRRNLLRIFQISGTEEILNVVPDIEAARRRLTELADARAKNSGGEEAT